jgi:uncharacterized protein YcaQ
LKAVSLSLTEARWLALEAQDLWQPRPPRPPKSSPALAERLGRLGTIQLDAVNVLARTQYLVGFARVGTFEADSLLALTGPGRPWFEYWGHAASIMPVSMHPLFRWRMSQWRGNPTGTLPQRRRAAWHEAHATYIDAVLGEVTERGPLAASQLSDPRRRSGEWWERRSEGRRALEHLFGEGRLAGWRAPNFERIYDLTERVIPRAVLEEPSPTRAEAERSLVEISARCLGVATEADLADYFYLRKTEVRAALPSLVADGVLVPAKVEGWRQQAYVMPGAKPRRPRRHHATLISPFDSLIWGRERTERLFGFRYRIEIYVPGPKRQHGYYVLPLLLGDRLVARFDLKADRKAARLMVRSAHGEADLDRTEIAPAAAAELTSMAGWLGLTDVAVSRQGDLASPLRSALRG